MRKAPISRVILAQLCQEFPVCRDCASRALHGLDDHRRQPVRMAPDLVEGSRVVEGQDDRVLPGALGQARGSRGLPRDPRSVRTDRAPGAAGRS